MDLTNQIFSDETKAREHLESIRWPNGPICPHCGVVEGITKLEGDSHRAGLHKCNSCKGHFTVTVGTVFEDSKLPLHKWVLAAHLMASSKKGFSAHQLHRTIKVSYKTAWFMMHRLREAMTKRTFSGPLGGEGKSVEADETYIGRKPGTKVRRGGHHKNVVFSLVERGGEVRSFHVPDVTAKTLRSKLREHVSPATDMYTDEAKMYRGLSNEFNSHDTVNHSKHEYVRDSAYTNTVEGYFSILKRGIHGTFHHVGAQHLQRYVAEFDFRYNTRTKLGYNDAERAALLLKSIGGKRLTYA